MVTDPVCKKSLSAEEAASRSSWQGSPYWFCSDVCRAVFEARPNGYLQNGAMVTVELPGGERRQVAHGTPIGMLFAGDCLPALARVHNEMVDLWAPIPGPCRVDWIPLDSAPGQQALMRTLLFILMRACTERFPHLSLRLQHTLAQQYYCEATGSPLLHTEDLLLLERHMATIVEANEPIVVHDMPGHEGIELLRRQGLHDMVAALESNPPAHLRLHRLGRSWTYSLGPLLPYTGLARPFALQPYLPGLILRFPISPVMDSLPPFVDQPRLFAVFHEHQRWCSAMGVRDLASLNISVREGGASDLIKMQESLHEKRIAAIADEIASRRLARVVLVAGPSSSGKTTFTKRLAIHLRVNGFRPLRVELDHYFRPALEAPRDANGEADFEHLDAIDVPLFNQHLLDLIAGRQVECPSYSFKTGLRSYNGDMLQLGPDQILLLEGIHGLNDALTPTIRASMKYRVYVSALTHASLDDHNRLSTHDVRLLRRILRDQRDRGYSPQETLHRWPSVVAGEEKWIFPFQEGADVMFNSALVYEISAVAPLVLPLLETVPRACAEYAHAAYLARILRRFVALPADEVPPTSLLREFIGGSSFR